jgi:hypothetical protein
MSLLTDHQLRTLWICSLTISIGLLGVAMILSNSIKPYLKETLFYCGIIGCGLFILTMLLLCCNNRLKYLICGNEIRFENEPRIHDRGIHRQPIQQPIPLQQPMLIKTDENEYPTATAMYITGMNELVEINVTDLNAIPV